MDTLCTQVSFFARFYQDMLVLAHSGETSVVLAHSGETSVALAHSGEISVVLAHSGETSVVLAHSGEHLGCRQIIIGSVRVQKVTSTS